MEETLSTEDSLDDSEDRTADETEEAIDADVADAIEDAASVALVTAEETSVEEVAAITAALDVAIMPDWLENSSVVEAKDMSDDCTWWPRLVQELCRLIAKSSVPGSVEFI